MTAQLVNDGIVVNHKKVMRLMQEHGLTVRPRRIFLATTDSDHDGPIFPNLAKDVVPKGPNQLWIADITYIAIAVGFVYLKSWTKDIGAQVKSGEVLATIEAPDLDQQLAQAKATLASAKANYDIAAITAGRYDVLVKKQAIAQQLADQSAADAAAKKAVMDANDANVKQLEVMQSFKQIVAPFDGVVTLRNTDDR